MCMAFPARIVALDSTDAIIDLGGHRRRASLLLRPEVDVDDWVLVAAGTVLRRIDASEARDLTRALAAAMAATEPRPTTPGGPR